MEALPHKMQLALDVVSKKKKISLPLEDMPKLLFSDSTPSVYYTNDSFLGREANFESNCTLQSVLEKNFIRPR